MSDLHSEYRHRIKRKKISGKSFIILPVIFFIGTYLLLYFTLWQNVSTIVGSLDLFFSKGEKSYSTEYNNIFVPVEETTIDTNEYVSIKNIQYPKYGEQFGQLIIEDCSIDAKLFMGDGNIALRNGVGLYYGSFVPGYGGTILVAGHNNTYFNGLKNAKIGQIVKIKTSYGNYEYKINDIQIKKSKDGSAYDLASTKENLIMYTCYPFDELGLTPQRCFVYAEFVSGPIIDKTVKEE